VVLAILLTRESKSLLIGEQAYPSVRDAILKIANAQPKILSANGLITLQLAPDQILAFLSLEFGDAMRATEIEAQVVTLEQKICAAQPQVVSLFIKPQTKNTFELRHHQRFAAAD
jgi:divalent metal cation (Fe/Co/Zn/Cd) transporter